MSEQSLTTSYFTFYPLPPLSGTVSNAMVYTGNPLYEKYYNAYSKPIDKRYYLDLFAKRKEQPPFKPEILGEELGYLHNVMVTDIAIGLLYFALMSRVSFTDAVNTHFVRFQKLQHTAAFPSISAAVLDLTQLPKIPFFEFFGVTKFNPKHYIKYTAQHMIPGGKFEIIKNYWTRYSKRIMRSIPNLNDSYVKQEPERLYRFIP